MKKNKSLQRFLAFLLSAAMLITYMPSPVYALEGESADTPEVSANGGDSGGEAKKESSSKAAPEAAPAAPAEPAPEAEPEPAAEPEESQVEETKEPETPETRAGPSDDSEAAEATEAAVEEKAEEAKEEEKPEYPAVKLHGSAGGVDVDVDAPKGALPEGVKIDVDNVSADEAENVVASFIHEDKEIDEILSVDVSFKIDGKKVMPKKSVTVKVSSDRINGADLSVYNRNSDKVVKKLDGAMTAKGGRFEVRDFSRLVMVTTKAKESKENNDAKQSDESGEDSADADPDSEALSEEESAADEDVIAEDEEALVDEETLPEEELIVEGEEEVKLNEVALTFKGKANSVNVTVIAKPGTFPEGTEMKVASVAKSEVRSAVEAAMDDEVNDFRAVDISFFADGKEVHPKKDVSVQLTTSAFDSNEGLNVVHIKDSGHPEVMGLTKATDTTAQFRTDGFSIYIVVDSGTVDEDARLSVHFVGVNGNTVTQTVTKNQLDRIEDYIFDPGVAGMPKGTIFKGWTDSNDYSKETAPKTIDTIRSEIANLAGEDGFTEGQEVTYYAMLFTPRYVTYLDEKGINIKTEEFLKRLDDTNNNTYTFNYTYVPYANEDPDDPNSVAEFIGWKQVYPEVSGAAPVYENGESVELSSDYIVQADVEFGHWLSFDKNGSGASYTGPVFILKNAPASTAKPSDPTRKGFEFVGWYEDAAGNTEFNWNSSISSNKTLYAKWEEHSTAYFYYNIWKQNVQGTGYDLAESIRVENAAVGTGITYVTSGNGSQYAVRIYNNNNNRTRYAAVNRQNKQYPGFHLERYDTGKTVASNNSTVVNIYYDRNTYTLSFQYHNGYRWTTFKTIEGLYGTPIGDQFPIASGNGYDRHDGDRWDPQSHETFNNVIIYIKAIPAEDITFHLSRQDNYTTRYFTLYEEALPDATDTVTYKGKKYTEMSTVSGKLGYVQYSLDFVDIEGYKKAGADPDYPVNSEQHLTGNEYKFYYDRERYTLHYRDGTYIDKNGNPIAGVDKLGELGSETVAYGFPLAGYDTKVNPTRDEYNFLGWYADEACETPYDFANGAMPMNDVYVYAKWQIKRYPVTIKVCDDDGADKAHWTPEGQALSMTLDYNETISLGKIERDYHDFIAWYSDPGYTHLFNTDLPMNDTNVPEGSLTIYARWRSKLDGADGIKLVYDATDDGSNAPSDLRSYTDKAEAIAGTASQYKDNTKHFQRWVILDKNGAETSKTVVPGNTFVVDVNDAVVKDNGDGTKSYTITLRAVYEPVDTAKLTFINFYNGYGGLVKNEGGTEANPTLAMNQDVDVPAEPTAENYRPGYTLKGWTKKPDNGADVTTSSSDTLFIRWENGSYNYSKVAADEILVDGGKHEALYCVWEADDVDYTVEFYYQNDNGEGYTKDDKLTDTRTAKTDSSVEVKDADKAQTKSNKYKLHEGSPSVFSATLSGSGDTVLKLYFDLNKADVTVEHYLFGTTDAFKTATVEDQTVGSTFELPLETKYQGKDLTFKSSNPVEPVTVEATGNVVKIYYTLPLTITAKTDSKEYDGTPLNGAYTVEGALDADKTVVESALGEAPSITNVSESPLNYLTAEDQAKITGIPGYYVVSYIPGTLTISTADSSKLGLSVTNYNAPYDAAAHTVTATTTVTEGTTISYSTDNQNWSTTAPTWTDVTEAQTVYVKAENANYDTATASGTVTITPLAITVNDTATETYDGKEKTLTIAASKAQGVLSSETLTLTGAEIKGTDVGSYTTVSDYTWSVKKADGTTDSTGNYTIAVSGTLTIQNAAADKLGLSVINYNAPYDAAAHTVTATTTVTEGTTISYSTDNQNWSTTAPTWTDVTEAQTVYVKAENSNYATANSSGTVTITPLAIIVNDTATETYDGKEKTLTIKANKATGVLTGETLTLTGAVIKGTDAGSYTDVAEYTWSVVKADGTTDSTGNYTIDVTGTLTINTADSGELGLSVTNYNAPYDAAAHTVTATTTVTEGTTISYSTDNQNWSTTAPTWTDVTEAQTVYVKAENANYDTATASGTVTITPLAITVNDTATETYDGKEKTLTIAASKAIGVLAGETLTLTGAVIKGTDAGSYTDVADYTWSVKKADGTTDSTGNYTIAVSGTLTISAVTDKVTVKITENSGSEKYDGSEKTVTGYTVTSISNPLYTEADFTFSGDATVKGTDAGSYPMQLKAVDFTNISENFTNVEFVIVDGTLEIAKRKVTLTSATDSKVYDGTALTNSNVTVGGDKFASGEGATYNVTGTITNVGSTPNAFTYTLNEGTKASNYDISTAEGTLTVTAVTDKVTVTITENSGSEKYDGSEKTVTGYTVTSISNPLYKENDFKFSGNATVKGTDAGSYPMQLKAADFENNSKNFTNVEFVIVDGTLEIAKRSVTLTSATDSKPYDGTALTNSNVTVGGDGFASGEGAVYTVTGSQKIPGSSPNTFAYDLNDGTKASNYSIAVNLGTLTVTNRDAKYEITVEANSAGAVYDGKEHSAIGFKTLTFEVEGNKYTVSGLKTEDPKKTDAGEYTNNITGTAKVTDADKNDVTSQFAVSTKNGSLSITPAAVTLTSATASKVYDGTALTDNTVTAEGFAGNDGAAYTVTGSQTLVGSSPNTFTYTLNEGTKADNYTITTVIGTLTVTDSETPDDPINPDLVVTKSAKGEKFALGDTVTFTIVATNIYDKEQTITLSEIDGVTLAKASEKAAAGEKFETTATYTIKEADIVKGSFTNTVTAKVGNITKTADATVTTADKNAHLTVAKTTTSTAPKDGYALGDKITYKIEVKNDGNVTISNIKVTDTVQGYAAEDISDKLDKTELKPGETATAVFEHVVTEQDILAGSVKNNATAKGKDPEDKDPDVVPGTTEDPTEGLDTTMSVKKEISNKPADGKAFKLGETIEYKITVKNEGNATYKNVNVVDKQTGFSTKIASLAVGEEKTFETSHTVTEADILAGSYTNTVTAKGDPIPDPKDPENPKTPEGEDTVTTGDEDDPDNPNPPIEDLDTTLSVNKAISNKPKDGKAYTLGETIEYTITVRNDGNAEYKNVNVVDKQTGFSTKIDTLAVGETKTFKTSHKVTEADILAGSYTNTVTAKGDPIPDPKNPDDPKIPEGDDSTTTGDKDDPDGPNPPVDKENPELTVNKTARPAGRVRQGQVITYTVTVSNTGNVTIKDITIDDSLVEFADGSDKIESLAPGRRAVITYTYTVTAADAANGRVVNTATATGKDPNGKDTPGTDTVEVTVRNPGGGGNNPGGGGNPNPNPGGGGNPGVTPAGPDDAPEVIPDEPVPEVEPEIDIPDDGTPLAGGAWALVNLISAILTSLGAAVALFRKKEEDDEEEDEEGQNKPKKDEEDEEDNRGKKMLADKILGAVAGVAAPVAFILTEDMSLPMQMIDKWTLLMLAILAAQIVTAILNKRASKLDDDEEEAEASN